eukprot:Hpha_TRINITY_DN11121_c0_g1::TRINITY_DN11121_c0_g1_i1::g.27918::m.27918
MSASPGKSVSRQPSMAKSRRKSSHKLSRRQSSTTGLRRRGSGSPRPPDHDMGASQNFAGAASGWLRRTPSGTGRRRSRSNSLADSLRSLSEHRAKSVNPELDEEDQEGIEAMLMSDDALRDKLEVMWYAFLDHDPYLTREQGDVKLFRHWAKQVGLVREAGRDNKMEVEREAARVMDSVSIAMGSHEEMTQARWLRALCHAAFYKEPSLDRDHTAGMNWLVSTYLDTWLQRHRERNENDGLQPGDGLFQPLDCDRLLYIYDTPFTKLFERYRDQDQHRTRALSFQEMRALGDYVELTELRDFCKDYGFFPRQVSFVEISKVAQLSCFGKIVMDPARQVQATDGVAGVTKLKKETEQDLQEFSG